MLTIHQGRVYAMPINLGTINQFYNTDFTPTQARDFIVAEIRAANAGKPGNLEEKAISFIGKPLYEAFIKGYTSKQWGRPPGLLPADIITRLPVRITTIQIILMITGKACPKTVIGGFLKNCLSIR